MPANAAIRRALDLTPESPTRARTIDITTTGRRTGRPRRIEIFFYRVRKRFYLNSGLLRRRPGMRTSRPTRSSQCT
ncbi:hypothetical protein [Actinoplanes sp. ATCC 53533]|uniref:hypothetical protein n=1 Tax=Actinoplanes sp. ATCC 53533 TaxID=1288362 RepID=UPI0018F3CC71|nr:hypothetical protein [Actinoplanes sp. ATCC 53533]